MDDQAEHANTIIVMGAGHIWMRIKSLFVLIVYLACLSTGLYLASISKTLFLDTEPWMIVVSMGLGIVFGAARAVLKGEPRIERGEIIRHGTGGFLEHWGTVVGVFTSIASGIPLGFLFVPQLVNTPEDAVFVLNAHFIGIVLTLFTGFYFLTDFMLSGDYGRLVPNLGDIVKGTLGKYLLQRKQRAEDKYLSSQKSAFLIFAILGAVLLGTGAIKVAAHIWLIRASVWAAATLVHDISSALFILFLGVHVLFVLSSPKHRLLLTCWFTGKISQDYVKEEHALWYKKMCKEKLR